MDYELVVGKVMAAQIRQIWHCSALMATEIVNVFRHLCVWKVAMTLVFGSLLHNFGVKISKLQNYCDFKMEQVSDLPCKRSSVVVTT